MNITSLVEADQHLLIWSVLLLVAGLGFWADRTKVGSTLSGAAIVLIVAMLLSNLGAMPQAAPVYDTVWSYLVPVAVPLLLFKANLRQIFAETGPMLLAFSFGVIGSTVGALIGATVLDLGQESAALAAVFSATYIGGSMNFAAVSQAVGLEEVQLGASLAADNVVGVLYLVFLAVVPTIPLLVRLFAGRQRTGYEADAYDEERMVANQRTRSAAETGEQPQAARFDLVHVALLLGASCAIVVVASAIAHVVSLASYSILFITALTVIIANLFPAQLQRLQGDFELGLLCMYVFFGVIGAGANIAELLGHTLIIAAFAAMIVVVHVLITFGAGWLFKIDLMEVVVASNACASGPASAAALAASRGRQDLVVAAVLLGVLGYVLANFIGIALYFVLGGPVS